MPALSVFEHARDARPSILPNIYLSLRLLFDIASVRALWLSLVDQDSAAFTGVLTATAAVKAFAVLLESKHKTRWIPLHDLKRCPEETTGIYGLATCNWMAKLLLTGYGVILEPQHLYPLEKSMGAEHLQQEVSRLRVFAFHGKQYALVRSVLWELRVPFVLPFLTRAAQLVGMWTYILENGGLDGELAADAFSQGQKQLFTLSRAILRHRIRASRHADTGDTIYTLQPGDIGLEAYQRDYDGGI